MRRLRPVITIPCIALVLLLLAGCASRGTPVDADENYDGPVALAILPVAEGRSAPVPEVSRWWIQKLMAEELDRAGLFAGIVPLPDAQRAHEAGFVLDPLLTGLDWRQADQRAGTLSLRIRVRDAASGAIRLDRVYEGSCARCAPPAGQPAVAGPLAELMKPLRRDLEGALAHP